MNLAWLLRNAPQIRAWKRENDARREADRRAHRVSYPRADTSWNPAEDQRLLHLVETTKPPHGLQYKRWSVIGKKLGRTPASVQTRFYALRAGLALASYNERRR